MASIAARRVWLKPVFCWKVDSSSSGSDSIISSIEYNEAQSDGALSSLLTLSRFAERLSDERLVAVVVLVEGRPLRALALEARFGCAVVDVATFPGKARFSRFSSCPLDLWKLFKRYIDCFSFLHVRTDLYGGKQFRRHDICTVHYIRYDLPTSLTATRCPRSPRLRK